MVVRGVVVCGDQLRQTHLACSSAVAQTSFSVDFSLCSAVSLHHCGLTSDILSNAAASALWYQICSVE